MRNNILLVASLVLLAFSSCRTDQSGIVALRLDETEIDLVKGEEKQLIVNTVPMKEDAVFKWSSSMPEYVSVSETGVVKAEKIYYKNGTDEDAAPVSVYCVCEGGAAECKVTVLPLEVEDMKIRIALGATLVIMPGEYIDAFLDFYPEDADVVMDDIEWSTTAFEYAVVEVDKSDRSKARIKALWPGSASIKASYGSKSASINLIVKPIYAESLEIDGPEEVNMKVGDAKALTASFTPADATVEVVWSSTDTQVATVDADSGIVTAVAEGEVQIKAIAGVVEDVVTVKVTE